MRLHLIRLLVLGWTVWMSPIGGTWSKLDAHFDTKEDCVDFLFAFTKERPDLLEGHSITCRPVGTDPNQSQGQSPSSAQTNRGQVM